MNSKGRGKMEKNNRLCFFHLASWHKKGTPHVHDLRRVFPLKPVVTLPNTALWKSTLFYLNSTKECSTYCMAPNPIYSLWARYSSTPPASLVHQRIEWLLECPSLSDVILISSCLLSRVLAGRVWELPEQKILNFLSFSFFSLGYQKTAFRILFDYHMGHTSDSPSELLTQDALLKLSSWPNFPMRWPLSDWAGGGIENLSSHAKEGKNSVCSFFGDVWAKQWRVGEMTRILHLFVQSTNIYWALTICQILSSCWGVVVTP